MTTDSVERCVLSFVFLIFSLSEVYKEAKLSFHSWFLSTPHADNIFREVQKDDKFQHFCKKIYLHYYQILVCWCDWVGFPASPPPPPPPSCTVQPITSIMCFIPRAFTALHGYTHYQQSWHFVKKTNTAATRKYTAT